MGKRNIWMESIKKKKSDWKGNGWEWDEMGTWGGKKRKL